MPRLRPFWLLPQIALLWVIGFVGVLPFAAPAHAQSVPSGGQSLVNVADIATQGSFRGGSTTGGAAVATRTVVPVSGQSFTQAARIEVLRPTGDFWSAAVSASSNRAVAQGDVVLIRFFLRAIQTTDETGNVFLHVYAEGPGPGFNKSLSQQAIAGTEWIEYFMPFEVEEAYASGQFSINFGFGEGDRPRVLDLAGVEVIWYGKTRTLAEMPRTSFNYDGRAADAPWRAEAAARIDQYRKANYSVRVVDAAGQPVPGAQVRFRLRRHAFPFSTAVVASRIMDSSSPANQTYRHKLLELFNAAGPENDLKWPPWEGNWGSGFNRQQTLAALDWLHARGMRVRGHVLVWPSARNLPNSITALPRKDPSIPGRIRDHIADIVPATKDRVVEWDVLNEPYDNHDLMDDFGPQIMADWFKEARKHHPTARLFINDYGILSGGGVNAAKQQFYEDTIRYLLDQGAPVGGIGMQGHMGGSPTGIPRVWTVLERYAQAFPDLKIGITEFDVDTDDEQLQADYTRDFLTLVFSHPSVNGFQMWGFWEGAHWRGKAAMYRTDWSEKPNGKAYRELVHGTWRTDDLKTTGGDGRVNGRGFHGDYDVVVTAPGLAGSRSFTLPAGGGETTVQLSANTARLVNIATRGRVGTGADSMIAGFVIAGGSKELAIRGVGPILGTHPFNLDFLADPFLQLLTANPVSKLAENDNWVDSRAATAGGLSLVNDPKSAGLVRTLQAGGYTAQLTGVNSGMGIALIEVYDLEPAGGSRLINLSTRGRVGTDANVLIGSFVIQGSGRLPILIRAIGPTLGPPPYNVPGVLADPQIALYRGDTKIAENNDWREAANASAIEATMPKVGAFPIPADSKDSALLLELEAGAYTVHVSGVNNGTGVALVEVYVVP
jgi:endo-1,4-beta-xylanase